MSIRITRNNKVRALFDMWVFCDLIKYRGGTKAFSTIHEELVQFITAADAAIESDDIDAKVDVVMRALVLMPRGHLKSTICVTLYCLWRIYRNPNIRIMVGTDVKELSWAFIRELRSYFEDRDLQETVWNSRPHISGPLVPDLDRSGRRRGEDENEAQDKKIIWSATALQVLRSDKMKEPTVRAGSVGSINTGEHYDLVILDDIVDFKNTKTSNLIEKTFNWAQDLESVVDPRRAVHMGTVSGKKLYDHVGDQVLVLGTRYARGDYYEYLIENKLELGYNVMFRNVYRNGVDDTEGYLWPERFNAKVVASLRKRLKGKKFASQYMNKIITEETQPLNPENIQYYVAEPRANVGYVDIWTEEGRVIVRPYLVIDPAISMDMRADDTSICVGGLDTEGRFWVLEQHLGHFKPEKTASIVYDLVLKWHLQTCYVENVGFQRALMYTIDDYFKAKNVHMKCKEWKPHGKGAKKPRIENYLEPYFSGRRIFLPAALKYNSTIQDSVTYFPSDVVKDDAPDTWAILIEIAKPPVGYTDKFKKAQSRPPAAARRNRKYGGSR